MYWPGLAVFCVVAGVTAAGHDDAVVDIEVGAQAVNLLELAHVRSDEIPVERDNDGAVDGWDHLTALFLTRGITSLGGPIGRGPTRALPFSAVAGPMGAIPMALQNSASDSRTNN